MLDLSYQVITDTFDKNPDAHLLIWIGLSSLDKIGHRFGPQSKEAVDTIYHLDTQMDSFMDQLAKIVSPKQTFYVLTADHGIMPIPELLKQCYNKKNPGQRVLIHEVKDLINKDIKQQYGVGHVVSALPAPYVYLNQEKLDTLPPTIQFNVLGRIKEILESIPGIKNVYSAQDLYIQSLKRGNTQWLFANQMYPRRSGHFVLEVEPGVLLAKKTKGTGHNSPSDYNLHVPLIFYQPQVSNHRVITKKVWIPQMTRTLATILNVEAPSPYSMAELPG